MIKNGLVVKLNDAYIIVMTGGSDYEYIIRREQVDIGSKIMYTEEDIIYPEKVGQYFTNYKMFATVAGFMIIIVLGFIFQSMTITAPATNLVYENNMITTIIAVDINPSFQLMANSDNRVIEVKATNKDANKIDSSSILGLHIDEAIERTIFLAEAAGFIDTMDTIEDYVLITVISKDSEEVGEESQLTSLDRRVLDDAKADEVRVHIQESAILEKVNVAVTSATQQQLQEAGIKNIPVGLYVAGIEEKTTVKEYFSDKNLKEEFKNKGKVIEKEESQENHNALKDILDALKKDKSNPPNREDEQNNTRDNNKADKGNTNNSNKNNSDNNSNNNNSNKNNSGKGNNKGH